MYVNGGMGWKREILESMDLMPIMRNKPLSIDVEVVTRGKARHTRVSVEVVGVVVTVAWSCQWSQNKMRPREEACGHVGTRSAKMCGEKHDKNARRKSKNASMKKKEDEATDGDGVVTMKTHEQNKKLMEWFACKWAYGCKTLKGMHTPSNSSIKSRDRPR